MKCADVIKILEIKGWFLSATGSKHRQFRHISAKGQLTLPIAGSKDLHPRILNSISKLTGIPFLF